MTITIPALLFSAISLLMIAYTNRSLLIAQLTQSLYKQNLERPHLDIHNQVVRLKERIIVIRRMQVAGILSLILCVATMIFLFLQFTDLSNYLFGASLALLLLSLCFNLYDVQISGQTLNFQLENLEITDNNLS